MPGGTLSILAIKVGIISALSGWVPSTGKGRDKNQKKQTVMRVVDIGHRTRNTALRTRKGVNI